MRASDVTTAAAEWRRGSRGRRCAGLGAVLTLLFVAFLSVAQPAAAGPTGCPSAGAASGSTCAVGTGTVDPSDTLSGEPGETCFPIAPGTNSTGPLTDSVTATAEPTDITDEPTDLSSDTGSVAATDGSSASDSAVASDSGSAFPSDTGSAFPSDTGSAAPSDGTSGTLIVCAVGVAGGGVAPHAHHPPGTRVASTGVGTLVLVTVCAGLVLAGVGASVLGGRARHGR